MADEQDKQDKTEEATPRRLEQAREKGDVVYSQEVGMALSLLMAALLISLAAGPIVSGLTRNLVGFVVAPHEIALDPRALQKLAGQIGMIVFAALGLTALAMMAAGIASRYMQDRPTFTAERLKPTLDKIDPIKGFGRVFGAAAVAQFLKSLAKLVVVGAALTWALWPTDATLETLPFLDIAALLPLAQERATAMLVALVVAAAVIAAIDYIATRQSYMKRQRMSRRDIKDEYKQSEGDPMVKMRLRQLRMERSRTRMMAQVPDATVVITNPTHYAVALRYVQGETQAPVCLAKGVDEVAARIRETAEAHKIPIVRDPPLARALFATADLDAPIPREHFEAVAKVIGFVMGAAARRRSPTRDANR